MYGTQTEPFGYGRHKSFENDVKMYGTQTKTNSTLAVCKFENDVKMYGTQTRQLPVNIFFSLRMM